MRRQLPRRSRVMVATPPRMRSGSPAAMHNMAMRRRAAASPARSRRGTSRGQAGSEATVVRRDDGDRRHCRSGHARVRADVERRARARSTRTTGRAAARSTRRSTTRSRSRRRAVAASSSRRSRSMRRRAAPARPPRRSPRAPMRSHATTPVNTVRGEHPDDHRDQLDEPRDPAVRLFGERDLWNDADPEHADGQRLDRVAGFAG